jgi:hypothetical protein
LSSHLQWNPNSKISRHAREGGHPGNFCKTYGFLWKFIPHLMRGGNDENKDIKLLKSLTIVFSLHGFDSLRFQIYRVRRVHYKVPILFAHTRHDKEKP